MKSKLVLISALALGLMAPQAKALDLGVGSNTQVGVGGINAGVRTNNDASAGILARNDIRARARAEADANSERAEERERARIDDESDARFHAGGGSNINADTSAGADENASLRASMRNHDEARISDRTNVNTAARINANTSADTGLFGISTRNNAQVRGGLND